MQNGKGDAPRPMSVSHADFAKKWEQIFKKPKTKTKKAKK